MIFKKVHFPIFIVIAFSIFISCNKKIENPINEKYSLNVKKAFLFYDKQEYDSAYYYFYKANDACSDQEKERRVYALYYLAEIQQKRCDFSGSEATATSIISILPDYKSINTTYNLIGISHLEQYNYESAHKYFNLAKSTALTEEDKFVHINNIAYTFLESKEYNKAEQLLLNLSKDISLIQDKPNYAKVLDNLGYAYFKLNNPKAIDYLNQSLKIRDSINNNSELIASYMHMAEYYLKSNLKLSNDFAQKAYNAAKAINSPDDRIEAIKFLIASSNTNKVKSLALKQMNISDSINKVRQNSKTQFAKIKYDANIALKESEKQKSQKQLYLSLFIFVSTISLFVFFTIRSKNRRKLQKATYDTETRISKKLHDELANDVFNAMTYADTQDLNNPTNKEFLLENLDKIYTQARNISKENSQIDTGDNFEAVLKAMLSSYNSNNINVIVKNNTSSADWQKLKKESKIVIYRTLQELMVNMRKHSSCSLVVIGFETYKKGVEINYSDNGIGCSELLNLKKGLQNAENRILSINGTITFETETNKGFKAKLKIPK
jgi:signal transduction histidine kinase